QGKKIVGPTPEALVLLKKYDWPGNIRELENVIEHAFILEEGTHLTVQSLPESFLLATGVELNVANLKDDVDDLMDDEVIEADETQSEEIVTISGETLDFNKHKEAFERELITKALKMFKGR